MFLKLEQYIDVLVSRAVYSMLRHIAGLLLKIKLQMQMFINNLIKTRFPKRIFFRPVYVVLCMCLYVCGCFYIVVCINSRVLVKILIWV